MKEKNNIIGFYVSHQSLMAGHTDAEKYKADTQGELFSNYVWHNSDSLKKKTWRYSFQ